MATTIIQTSGTVGTVPRITGFQRYILRRSHPTSLFIEAAGLLWVVFFLWNHLIVEALLVLVFSRLIANVIAFRSNTDAIAQTVLGRIALLHLQPVNMLVQIVGTLATLYGVWMHEGRIILAGLTAILLGHLIGWARVDRRLELE